MSDHCIWSKQGFIIQPWQWPHEHQKTPFRPGVYIRPDWWNHKCTAPYTSVNASKCILRFNRIHHIWRWSGHMATFFSLCGHNRVPDHIEELPTQLNHYSFAMNETYFYISLGQYVNLCEFCGHNIDNPVRICIFFEMGQIFLSSTLIHSAPAQSALILDLSLSPTLSLSHTHTH